MNTIDMPVVCCVCGILIDVTQAPDNYDNDDIPPVSHGYCHLCKEKALHEMWKSRAIVSETKLVLVKKLVSELSETIEEILPEAALSLKKALE